MNRLRHPINHCQISACRTFWLANALFPISDILDTEAEAYGKDFLGQTKTIDPSTDGLRRSLMICGAGTPRRTCGEGCVLVVTPALGRSSSTGAEGQIVGIFF